MTKVSAIIPVYNGEATVAKAIDSALAQQFDGELEVVVVNDGSTDSTPQVLGSYGSRIKVVAQPNRGSAAARNAGVASSCGEYLAFLDSDDIWLPEHLAKTCAALDGNPRASMAVSDFVGLGENGEAIPIQTVRYSPSMEDLLLRGWGTLPSAVVMRRSIFDACGGFYEGFHGDFEDVYMWLRARELGEFEFIAEPLMLYRIPPFASRADKYEAGRRTFERLVRARYGKLAKPLIRHHTSYFAPSLAQKALIQIASGDRAGAITTWIRVLRCEPLFFFKGDRLRRLITPRNLRRLAEMIHLAPHPGSNGQ